MLSAKQRSPPRRRLSGFPRRPVCPSAAQPERRPAGVFSRQIKKKSGAWSERGLSGRQASLPAGGNCVRAAAGLRTGERNCRQPAASFATAVVSSKSRSATAIGGRWHARRSFLSALAPTSAGGSRPVLARSASAVSRPMHTSPSCAASRESPAGDIPRCAASRCEAAPAPASAGPIGARPARILDALAHGCPVLHRRGARRAALACRRHAAGAAGVFQGPRTITSGLLCHGGSFCG